MGQPSFDWQHKFKHAKETVYVQGRNLSASGERQIAGSARKEDHGMAEIALLAATVNKVKVGEKTEFDRERRNAKRQDIPSKYDPATGKTTAELLLEHIVTKVAPHLAEKFEETFGVYHEGDEGEDMEEVALEESPTGRSSGALIEFPDEEAM